jgi:hypothetical protein
MPVYSISRSNQYTTIAGLQSKSAQDGITWNGFDAQGYASNFIVNLTTVCPTANRTWNYFADATNPSAASVWYPYSISLAVSGGNPNNEGYRQRGIAYLNLYSSSGDYLMGSYNSNILADAGTTAIFTSSGPSVQASTFTFTNSRNTLTLNANTTYLAGFVSPTTPTAFWNIFARTVNQSGQNVYYATGLTYNDPFTIITPPNKSVESMMGFITYNAAPVKPTNLVITTTVTGIQITCRCNETHSLSSADPLVGNVSRILFLFSEDDETYKVLTTDTSITRTLVSGTTYQYAANASGTYSNIITIGKKYYFKVAAINDLCIQYQAEEANRIAAGEASAASLLAQYGRQQFIKIRNATNTAWVYPVNTTTLEPTLTRIRDALNTEWINGEVYIRNANNDDWILN